MRSQTLERDEARKKGAVSSALTASLQSPTSAKDFDHIQNLKDFPVFWKGGVILS